MQPKTLQYNDFPIEVTATLVSGVGLVMAGMKACDVVLPEKSKRTSRYPPVWVDSAVRLLTEAIEVTTNVERKLGMQLERTWWMSLQREKRRVSSKSYHVVCKTGEET
jgi:hypothetical protein